MDGKQLVNDCQQVRKVRCRQCEGVGEDTERLRPVPDEEVEVTSVRERGGVQST